MSDEKVEILSARQMFQKGVTTSVPIMLGYLPVAITYGVLASQSGMTLLEVTLMSVFVYAGASQFMAINMIAVQAGLMEIVIATFVLNFRHFVMNLSFMNRLRDIDRKWKIPLSLLLTDETFAVSMFQPQKEKQKNAHYYYIAIFLLAYLTWIFGSLVGGLLGEVIPASLSQSMGIALYAMFIGLLVPTVKQNLRIGLIAIIAMSINFICLEIGLSSGWAIVVGTIIGGMFGIFLLKEDEA